MHSSDILEDDYLGSGRRLRYSINKYGKENHTREIVEFCKTRKGLKSREKEIVTLNEIAKKNCMNLAIGGGGTYIHTKEARKKISKYHLGKILTEDHKKNIGLSGIGRIVTEETRRKISEGQSGPNGHWYGKKMSTSHKRKISSSMKGTHQQILSCPHCGNSGGNNMKRYHFDNCKKMNLP